MGFYLNTLPPIESKARDGLNLNQRALPKKSSAVPPARDWLQSLLVAKILSVNQKAVHQEKELKSETVDYLILEVCLKLTN